VEETKSQQEANKEFQKDDTDREKKLSMWRFEADKHVAGQHGHAKGEAEEAQEDKQNQRRSQRRGQ
jgi:hypothetical protein